MVLLVCLSALIVLGVVGLTGAAEVPDPLIVTLLCASASAACVALRRP